MKSIIILVLILSGWNVHSQQDEHIIDVKMKNCISDNDTTWGMVECVRSATAEWDSELNHYYKLLMTSKYLNEFEKEQLKNSQRQWVKFRDLETAFLKTYNLNNIGTMYINEFYLGVMELTRTRAIDIKWRYVTRKLLEHG